MLVFLQSDQCPNFVKADVKRAKQHNSHADNDDDTDSDDGMQFDMVGIKIIHICNYKAPIV